MPVIKQLSDKEMQTLNDLYQMLGIVTKGGNVFSHEDGTVTLEAKDSDKAIPLNVVTMLDSIRVILSNGTNVIPPAQPVKRNVVDALRAPDQIMDAAAVHAAGQIEMMYEDGYLPSLVGGNAQRRARTEYLIREAIASAR